MYKLHRHLLTLLVGKAALLLHVEVGCNRLAFVATTAQGNFLV